MAKERKTITKVKCEVCENIIPVALEYSTDNYEEPKSSFDVYCPFCDDWLSVEVKGKIISDTTILRATPKNKA